MNKNNQEYKYISFGRLEGLRIPKRGFWVCFGDKRKKVRSFRGLEARLPITAVISGILSIPVTATLFLQ